MQETRRVITGCGGHTASQQSQFSLFNKSPSLYIIKALLYKLPGKVKPETI